MRARLRRAWGFGPVFALEAALAQLYALAEGGKASKRQKRTAASERQQGEMQ